MSDQEHFNPIKIFAPLLFRASDKFFKIISWIIILVAIRYAHTATNNTALNWLNWIATSLIGATVLVQALYIAVRDPDGYGIPKQFHAHSRIIQIIIGFGLAMIITSPALVIDQIIEALTQARRP